MNIDPQRHDLTTAEPRTADLTRAADALYVYGDLAGSEALTRALVAERTGEHDQARFWIRVYQWLPSSTAD